MLFCRWMAFIVKVVKQSSCGIKLDQCSPPLAREPAPLGFLLAIGRHASFNGERMLAQAFALGPFCQQVPSIFASKVAGSGTHFSLQLTNMVRVSLGFAGCCL